MPVGSLKYLSEAKLAGLRRDITIHRDRYEAGDFLDLEHENGWAIESSNITADYDALASLDGEKRTADGDISASIIVHKALIGMTPALAREERVWSRLTHIECLEYSRSRWLTGKVGDDLDKQINIHLFANGLTGIRDDNALSRLWWNMHIAKITDPVDPEDALKLILKTSDIRSNFVERTNTATRKPLARAIIRAMRTVPWITSSESAFREFMIVLNRNAGGVLFEVMTDAQTDEVIKASVDIAQAHKATKVA